MSTQQEKTQNAIDNLAPAMEALSKLPDNQFDEAILTLAVLTINTVIHRQGKQYTQGLFESALSHTGPLPIIVKKGTTH